MKRKSFDNVLQKYDTLFDGLTIGICARENNMTVRRTKSVPGSEKPSVNMETLIRQRIRWTKGSARTLTDTQIEKFNFHSCIAFKVKKIIP